jgi:hypothetical protein
MCTSLILRIGAYWLQCTGRRDRCRCRHLYSVSSSQHGSAPVPRNPALLDPSPFHGTSSSPPPFPMLLLPDSRPSPFLGGVTGCELMGRGGCVFFLSPRPTGMTPMTAHPHLQPPPPPPPGGSWSAISISGHTKFSLARNE